MRGAHDLETFLFDRDFGTPPQVTYAQTDLPNSFGLEFFPVRGYWQPYPEHPPLYKGNLVFRKVYAIGLFSEDEPGEEPLWYRTLLQDANGDRNTFMIVERLFFDDLSPQIKIWKAGHALCGRLSDLSGSGALRLGLRGGIAGKLVDIAVVAEAIHWSDGGSNEVELEDIGQVAGAWWAYWKRYWRARRSDTPMPYDPQCEAAMPLKGALD